MAMNTTKTLERTSTVLGSKCEATQANMEKLMREAGCAGAKLVDAVIPMAPGSKDDVIFVGLNGVGFYFKRAAKVKMPEPVREILKNTGAMA